MKNAYVGLESPSSQVFAFLREGNASAEAALAEQAKANSTAGQFANGDYRKVLSQVIIQPHESHHSMSEQTLQNAKVFDEVAELLLSEVYARAHWQSVAIL